jgi:hypothetical protein
VLPTNGQLLAKFQNRKIDRLVWTRGGQFFMAKTKRINKINVICNSVMVITPILPHIAG